MKKSKVFVFTLMFALFGTVVSYGNSPATNPDEIRKEIIKMVKFIDLSSMKTEVERVELQFIINDNNEIIVVNVSKENFDFMLKNRLNYKKLKTEDVVKNKIYSVPMVFKKK